MPLLFSYGTLRQADVQLSLFGRTLEGRADALLGYEQVLSRVADPDFVHTSGKTHHLILRPARNEAARVEGMVFEVTEAELAKADSYEPAEYERVVADLASGGKAWVYVDAKAGNETA